MEDIRNIMALERTFEMETTINENYQLKQNNKFLIATVVLVGVVALVLSLYFKDQQKQSKEPS